MHNYVSAKQVLLDFICVYLSAKQLMVDCLIDSYVQDNYRWIVSRYLAAGQTRCCCSASLAVTGRHGIINSDAKNINDRSIALPVIAS